MSDRSGAGSLPAGTGDRVVLANDDERVGLHGEDAVVVVGRASIAGYRRSRPAHDDGVPQPWFRVRRSLGAQLTATRIPHLLECTGTRDGSEVMERVLAPDRAPAVLLEWRTERGATELELHITAGRDLELSIGAAAGRRDAEPRFGDGTSPALDRSGREAGGPRLLRMGETVSLHPAVEPGRPARLAVALPGADGVRRLLERLDERARGAIAAARRADAHMPVVAFPADVGARMARAGRGSAAAVPGLYGARAHAVSPDGGTSATPSALLYALCADGMRPLSPATAARAALARIALGDPTVAVAVLDGIAQAPTGGGQAELPLLYGMYVAWTGRVDLPRPWRAALVRACERWADREPTAPPAAVRSLVRAAAEAARDEELVAAVGPVEGGVPAGPASGPAPDEPAELLRLLAGPVAGSVLWPLLPERAAAEDELRSAANSVLGLIHGRLGVEPDAARGRLRLRLDLTAGRIQCEGIRLGDTRVDVRADVDPVRARIEARQTAGATPLQLVLEPEVSAAGIVSARVDDRAAELSPVRLGAGRFRVPVQLALDAPRTLVLELEPH